MAVAVGLNSVKSGLVYGHDTGYGIVDDSISSRYYLGQPTVNYAPVDFASWTLESGDVKRIATGDFYKGQPTYNCRTALGLSYISMNTTISGLRTAAGSSGTVTVSCMARNNNSSSYPMYAYIGHDFSSTRTLAANSDWQKIQWTVNQSSMANDYIEFRPYTNTNHVYLEMTMPMVEINKGYATQFVDGTRSDTQALLNITSGSTIDISNTSFDSDLQVTFDGTDDYILVPLTDVNLDGGCTIEGILKRKSTPGAWRTFFNLKPSGANTPFFEFRSTGAVSNIVTDYYNGTSDYLTSAFSMTNNQFYHCVGTHDANGNIALYINGTLYNSGGSVPDMSLGTSPRLTIGRAYSNDRYTDIDAPVVRVYDRVLTAAEIAKNYNSYRNRFGL